ncbi:hypothetical protein DMB90_01375 [Raoultella planticola]|uniref:Uncharacterized protein n=1 Tax=Raoultella planticola TaxID=575 RepID=A0A5P6A999_RAOPL|nr:hypothetical protein DMB90_01375 [Raoultella planticola]
MARWRTLHETTAILIFIAEGDEDWRKDSRIFRAYRGEKLLIAIINIVKSWVLVLSPHKI